MLGRWPLAGSPTGLSAIGIPPQKSSRCRSRVFKLDIENPRSDTVSAAWRSRRAELSQRKVICGRRSVRVRVWS